MCSIPTASCRLERLSLRQSFTVALTILLLIIPLGRPTQPGDYAVVLLASLASLSALILPLWGVHKQMGKARDEAASRISEELGRSQARLMEGSELDLTAATELANRTDKLVLLTHDDAQIAQLAISQRFFDLCELLLLL